MTGNITGDQNPQVGRAYSYEILFAQYCAVYNNWQKLDCDFEENINIKAAFNKSQEAYIGAFQSFFQFGKGNMLYKNK